MTDKELKEKIARLEIELSEVKEMAEAMKKRDDGSGVFKPEYGQDYWLILDSGEPYDEQWDDHEIDHKYYSLGNCFPTEQSARDTVRALKLIQKARESQNGFVPDWNNWAQNKHIVYYNRGVLCVRMYSHLNIAPIFGYWKNKSACEKFVDDNYDELTWFFTEYRR